MDFVGVAQEFGVIVAVLAFTAWWLRASLNDRIVALESANKSLLEEMRGLHAYMRSEHASLIGEAHVREREFVSIIRELKRGDGTPMPHDQIPRSAEDTQTILRAVHEKHERTPGQGSRFSRPKSGEVRP